MIKRNVLLKNGRNVKQKILSDKLQSLLASYHICYANSMHENGVNQPPGQGHEGNGLRFILIYNMSTLLVNM